MRKRVTISIDKFPDGLNDFILMLQEKQKSIPEDAVSVISIFEDEIIIEYEQEV